MRTSAVHKGRTAMDNAERRSFADPGCGWAQIAWGASGSGVDDVRC